MSFHKMFEDPTYDDNGINDDVDWDDVNFDDMIFEYEQHQLAQELENFDPITMVAP